MKISIITALGIGTLILAGCQSAFVCGGAFDPDKAVVTEGAGK